MPDKGQYRVVLEAVTQEKKKLKSSVSYNETAPNGFTFVPVGVPDLADYCKELSRKRGVDVYIVSSQPKSLSHLDPSHISHHIQRIGYHFRNDVVDTACTQLGLTTPGRDRPQRALASHPTSTAIARRLKAHGANIGDAVNVEGSEGQRQQILRAIQDLFPKIPEKDRDAIIERAFKEGSDRVGTQKDLSLSRRVQLAVTAHIRHTKTDYDELIRLVGWHDARKMVEQATLDQLLLWRDENSENDGELEDIFQEVIVIDDESDDEGAESGRDGRGTNDELVSDRRSAADLDVENTWVDATEHIGHRAPPEVISVRPLRAAKAPLVVANDAFQQRLQAAKLRVGRAGPVQTQTSSNGRPHRSGNRTSEALKVATKQRHRGGAPFGVADVRPSIETTQQPSQELHTQPQAAASSRSCLPGLSVPMNQMQEAARMATEVLRPSGVPQPSTLTRPANSKGHELVDTGNRHTALQPSVNQSTSTSRTESTRQLIDLTDSSPVSKKTNARYHPYQRPGNIAAEPRASPRVTRSSEVRARQQVPASVGTYRQQMAPDFPYGVVYDMVAGGRHAGLASYFHDAPTHTQPLALRGGYSREDDAHQRRRVLRDVRGAESGIEEQRPHGGPGRSPPILFRAPTPPGYARNGQYAGDQRYPYY